MRMGVDAQDEASTPARPSRAEAAKSRAELELQSDPESVARIICLRLLDIRARSRVELERALRKRGVPDEPAARVLDRFTELGLIDDAALAAAMAESAHRERGLARRGVTAKLRQRGFDDDVVADAVGEIDSEAERARAIVLVQRRQHSLSRFPAEVQARRLVGLLARKGYPIGMAVGIVREVLGELDSLDPDSLGAE